jgi:thiamine-monophosphate kinase
MPPHAARPDRHAPTTPGEFALISRIIKRLGAAAALDILVPPGDDAAIWRADSEGVVATIDALTEGTHWRADTMGFEDVGWRAVTANVSDLAAMGAEPAYLLVATSLGPSITPSDVDALVDGLAASCLEHGVRIAGGDVVRGPATMLTISTIGSATFKDGQLRALRRNSARVGDIVAVTGHPGASATGLAAIERGLTDDPDAAPLVAAHRRPTARVDVARQAIAEGLSCAIDISDGLLQDCDHIAEASKVGIEIDAEAIPLHPAAAELLGADEALTLALGGGEDFELVLVGDRSKLEALATDVTVIGRIVDMHPGETVALDAGGSPMSVMRRGWDQLSSSDSAP